MKINKLILVILAVVTVIGCEEVEVDNPLSSQRVVYFAESNATSIGEGAIFSTTADGESVAADNRGSATIFRTGNDVTTPLTVNFTTTVTYNTTTDFQNAGDDASSTVTFEVDGAATLPAGEYTNSFSYTAIDDVFPAGDKTITFTITSVSDASYSIGFPNVDNTLTSLAITVVDDDCPIDIPGDWEGEYVLTSFAGAPGSTNDGFDFVGDSRFEPAVVDNYDLTADTSDPLGQTAFIDSDNILGVPVQMSFITCPSETAMLNVTESAFTVGGAPVVLNPSSVNVGYSDGTGVVNLRVQTGRFGPFIMVFTPVE